MANVSALGRVSPASPVRATTRPWSQVRAAVKCSETEAASTRITHARAATGCEPRRWQRPPAPGGSEPASLLPGVQPDTWPWCCSQPRTPPGPPAAIGSRSLSRAPSSGSFLASVCLCKFGQGQERPICPITDFRGQGGLVHMWPLGSPAVVEQTGNPNGQDPASGDRPSGWVHIHLQIMLCDSPGC